MVILVGTYVLSTAPVFAGVIWMMARMTKPKGRRGPHRALARTVK